MFEHRLRVFWLTRVSRATPDAPAEAALTTAEIDALDRLATTATPVPEAPVPKRAVSRYVVGVAKPGGYLAREHDPPPGNRVIWRGLTRLADILLGLDLVNRGCGE